VGKGEEREVALACVMEAIPAADRPAHAARSRRLFAGSAPERISLVDGYAFRFAEEQLLELARFLENERRCCPFLRFELVVEPPGEEIWLRMTGPSGTREFLEVELPLEGVNNGELTGD
jgi:hypothetical protein